MAKPRQTSRGTIPTERGTQRAEEILETAQKLFVRQGFTNVTVKEIAEASGVNPALLYYYYRGKEDLFIAALRHAVEQAMARQAGLDSQDGGDPVSTIRTWFETNAKFAKPLAQMLMMMLDSRSSGRRSVPVQRMIAKFYQAELGLLTEAIACGVEQGVFRPVETAKVALFVSVHLDGIIVAAAVRAEPRVKQALRDLQDILFDYLEPRATALPTRRAGLRKVA